VDVPPTVEPEATRTPSPRRTARWYVWLGVGLIALVVVLIVVAAVRPRPQSDYDDAVRDRFLSACTDQGGDLVRDECVCFYEQLEQNVPFDRFEMLDESLATQLQLHEQTNSVGQDLKLPDDIAAMLARCTGESA
jgi:hypothetical protein